MAPRPVFCVIAEHHRDRAVAEAACAGRFTHGERTIDLGLAPDWRGMGPADDEEWRIATAKFYFGLDLAHTFAATREARFLAAWEALVRSWITTVPVDADPTDVTGRRIQNWIYAWDIFVRAPQFPGLSAGMPEALVGSLAAQVGHLREHLSAERNHRTLELYALFIAAVALPVLDDDGSLLPFAVQALHDNLLADVLLDGVHRERSTHYHMTTLRTYLGVRENARRFDVPLPPGYDRRLTRACEFALHCHRPDGTIPAVSDSDTGAYGDLLALAAGALGRQDFVWPATRGRQGTRPARRHASFPLGGYYVQRSDWESPDARYLLFDCGPLGDGGHGHYDMLHVEVAAGGRALLVDPGRYVYTEAGDRNWRHVFKGTAAHNTVTVDGLDQVPYRRGKPRGPLPQARLRGRHTAPGLDVLRGEVVSPCYEAVHARDVAFVDDAYWIVDDRLYGSQPHRYDLRFHLAPEAWERVTLERRAQDVVVHAPGVALVIVAPGSEVTIEPGWVSPSYGIKLLAPVVLVVARGVSEAVFTTVVMPEASGAVPEAIERRVGADGMLVTLRGVGDGTACDRVGWGGRSVRFGNDVVRAPAAWLRTTAAGTAIAFGAVDGARPGAGPWGGADSLGASC